MDLIDAAAVTGGGAAVHVVQGPQVAAGAEHAIAAGDDHHVNVVARLHVAAQRQHVVFEFGGERIALLGVVERDRGERSAISTLMAA